MKLNVKFAIIGGSGSMGKWLARQLTAEGHEVVISGRDRAKLEKAAGELGVKAAANAEAVIGADAVIMAASLEGFESAVRDIGPHLAPGQAILDIASVKARSLSIIEKHCPNARILGVHPMFGAGAKSFAGQNVVLTPTGRTDPGLLEKAEAFLAERGANVMKMPPEEHDRVMGVVLGLGHFIALATADSLLEAGDLETLAKAGGTTFKTLLTLARSVLVEDPAFYAELQTGFDEVPHLEKLFIEKAGEWAQIVKQGDAEGFAARMRSARERFEAADPGFAEGYGDMYRLLEG